MKGAVVCSECGSAAFLVAGARIYPHRKDLHGRKFWLCPCGAYVGCHPGTTLPLGSPAGKRLRILRQKVHDAIDPLWARKMTRDGVTKKAARGAAYAWLAEQVGVPSERAHIGMFDADQCKKAISALSSARKADS